MENPAVASDPLRFMRRPAHLPGVALIEMTFEDRLSRSVPSRYGTVLHLEGEAEWSVAGTDYRTRPGTLGVKVPGEVYAERRRRGRSRFEVLVFEDALIDEARTALERRAGTLRPRSFDGLGDPRVQPLMALHRAVSEGASTRAELEQALSEGLAALVELSAGPEKPLERAGLWGAAVARARALLDARLTESVTLEELAAHARLDKFRLCRAFREQVGLPPHAYVTHRRVGLAQELLAHGMPQAEVAIRVGLYDQSQLHRHFKRIVGITPGAYARAVR